MHACKKSGVKVSVTLQFGDDSFDSYKNRNRKSS